MQNYKKPFLGAAYYPEDWDASEMDRDIAKMKEAGITCARIGEFAWSRMEPRPGEYCFDWVHNVIDRLSAEGISVLLCTPTATPPVWLPRLYPDVTAVNDNGIRREHGGRRHCCSNNPHYVEYSKRIVERMAEEFGGDARVMGWQVDNEINFQNCSCPNCLAGFREHLRKKYGTVERLNRAWNLTLWSQEYSSFGEINIPINAWHNPHLKLEFRLFQSDSHSNFIGMQADILKRYTKAPIGTDTMPTNNVDYETLTEKCDVIQYNHYDKPAQLPVQRFWFDYMRTLKNRPFWNTETSTCWNGSEATAHDLKPYGFCRINSWMPVILGGESAMYWLWRTHWAGHELMHGAVLAASGRPMHIFNEVVRTSSEFDACAEFLNGTKVFTEVALHFTSLNWNMLQTQSVLKGFEYLPHVYGTVYEPLVNAGIRPDVIGARKDLSAYRLLFSPYMLTMDHGDLIPRVRQWVEQGGVWVVGPMSDLRDGIGARFQNRAYNMLEDFTGVRPVYEIPDRDALIKTVWSNGDHFQGNEWYELFEADGDELVTVTEGYPSLIGKACVLRKRVGKGTVYLLGTEPSAEDMQRLIAMAMADAGLRGYQTEGTLVVAPRCGDGGEGLIVAECGCAEGSILLEEPMEDLLTGKTFGGRVELAPYELLVLKKK